MIPKAYNPDYCDYQYHVDYLVSDVNTVLTSLTAQLVTAPVAANKWVENPAGTFENPSGDIKLAFSRIAADILQMVAYNRTAQTICTRRARIAAGTPYYEVRYYTGAYYCFVDCVRGTSQGETLMGFVVNPEYSVPADMDFEPAMAGGYRSSASVADGLGGYGMLFAWDIAAWSSVARMFKFEDASGAAPEVVTPTQNLVFTDVPVTKLDNPSNNRYFAKLPQAVIGPSSIASGFGLKVPITDGTMATFEGTSLSNGVGSRLYLRKA